MKNTARVKHRLIRPAAACAPAVAIAALTLLAIGAAPADRFVLARKAYRGAKSAVVRIPKPMVDKPLPETSDTITPNTPLWNLPPARPGAEAPSSDKPRLASVYVRSSVLIRERPIGAYQRPQYPDLQPQTALAWSIFPSSSELSVPAVLSSPDRSGAAPAGDPTAVQSRNSVLVTGPILRQSPVRFLRLDIPDPFAQTDAVKLDVDKMPPDNDPPTTPRTPADPTMPIAPQRR